MRTYVFPDTIDDLVPSRLDPSLPCADPLADPVALLLEPALDGQADGLEGSGGQSEQTVGHDAERFQGKVRKAGHDVPQFVSAPDEESGDGGYGGAKTVEVGRDLGLGGGDGVGGGFRKQIGDASRQVTAGVEDALDLVGRVSPDVADSVGAGRCERHVYNVALRKEPHDVVLASRGAVHVVELHGNLQVSILDFSSTVYV